MKVCFPVSENKGLNSMVFGHFGSVPSFIVFDTVARGFEEVLNYDRRHLHGTCRPMEVLGGVPIDAVVVEGIGNGAMQGLIRAGLKVYRARGKTVAENITAIENGDLEEILSDGSCGDRRHGHWYGPSPV
jgi:predicted Fe-Mo cluster-binding NifX family protein